MKLGPSVCKCTDSINCLEKTVTVLNRVSKHRQKNAVVAQRFAGSEH